MTPLMDDTVRAPVGVLLTSDMEPGKESDTRLDHMKTAVAKTASMRNAGQHLRCLSQLPHLEPPMRVERYRVLE